MRVICPHCQMKVEIENEFSGKTARCPECDNVFQVPIPKAIRLEEFNHKSDSPKEEQKTSQSFFKRELGLGEIIFAILFLLGFILYKYFQEVK